MNSPTNADSTENPAIDIAEIKVNGTVITPDEVVREMQFHTAEESQEAMVKKASEVLIIQLLLLQKGRKLGYDKDLPVGDDIPSEETIIGRLIAAEAKAPDVTEEECERYYNENKEHFFSRDMVELRHILLAAKPDDAKGRAQAKDKAESLIAQLVEAMDQFEALAVEHSDCPSKEQAGSLGKIVRGQTTPEFESVVFDMKEGLALEPVDTQFGFHVVFLDQKLQPVQLEFEQVKADIGHMLIEFGQRKAISQYVHTLVAEADIQGINFEVGKAIDK